MAGAKSVAPYAVLVTAVRFVTHDDIVTGNQGKQSAPVHDLAGHDECAEQSADIKADLTEVSACAGGGRLNQRCRRS